MDEPGINEPSPARVIPNADDDKYKKGYDSEGEIGPLFDAVADEIEANVEVEDEDAGLPTTMGGMGPLLLLPKATKQIGTSLRGT